MKNVMVSETPYVSFDIFLLFCVKHNEGVTRFIFLSMPVIQNRKKLVFYVLNEKNKCYSSPELKLTKFIVLHF